MQTGDAIRHLAEFLAQWEASLARRETVTVEIVTGRGNRSHHGRSRLRPAVTNWLIQKNFTFREVNEGCLKVDIKA